ncbi:Sfi1-domain-containing protein [Coniochaeta sp. PMI_546]|nr:Sfi1-domain-containing protein [Coniochaeta sp. PMI_546]
MPPKPSLPLRDGRLGSSSSYIGSGQQHHEPYYSNEDIRLLHEIVTTGEEILPNLPERDQLATNALFQAAEQVLPAHGYDPDHAPSNISRLIFKIGGLRSEGSLMDKFSSVLEGMGINLEIVESPEQQEHDQRDSSSVKSSTSAAVDQSGTFSISPRYDARRRRNSESAAPTVPIEALRDNVPTLFSSRARSVSFGSHQGHGDFPSRAAGNENRPPRHSAQPAKPSDLENKNVERQSLRPLPLRPLFVHDDETDDGFPYRRHDIEDYPDSGSEHVDEYAPSNVYQGRVDHEYDLPRIDDSADHFVGSSDTAAQTSDELQAEPLLAYEDRDAMEECVGDFQSHYAHRKAAATLAMWSDRARDAAPRHQHQEAEAVRHDRNLMLSQSLNVWRETAEAEKIKRLASQGPSRDLAEDARMERRATRAYKWIIVNKAFYHWYASAQDELERTAIARRHMLRKRYFTAWRSHQADIEAKIHKFRLRTLISIWRRTAIHQEVRENVAVQRYRHNLVKNVFNTWYDEYRAQLADDLWACRLKEKCMIVLQTETRRKVALYEDCLFYDQRFLYENVISSWREAAEELRMMVYGCTGQKILLDLQRAFEDWRTQASLNRKLREFSGERDRRTKNQVIDRWMTQTGEANQKGLLARRLPIQELVAHWRNEAKLRRFDNNRLRELQLEIISHWRLELKLASFERLSERRTKERILAKLRTAAAEAQTQAVQVLKTADTVAERREKASILRIWGRRTRACLDQQDTAAGRYHFSVASFCVERWYQRAEEEAARIAGLRAFAVRGAYYVATSNALEHWAQVTKRARRERLTTTYHTFRRQYKVSLAEKCLVNWRAATHESHGLSYDADNIYGKYLRDELSECVQLWQHAANMMQVIREVASTADQEVWWGKWLRRAKDLQETELDAADYYNDQTLSRCWRIWAFAMLQNKGRQHVVTSLQENNDKKLCRQVIAQWSQKATLDGTYLDLRSSVASRRSVRYGSTRALETSRFGSSVNQPSSQPPVEQLAQIDEDLGNIYTATPRRQYGRASEPARNLFLTNRKEFSQSLPQRPSSYSKSNSPPVAATPQSLAHIPSLPAGAGIPPTGSVYMGAQQSPSRRQFQDTTRLQPQQAPPDFDEDDISFAPSEGNDYPATFMSTPTRRSGTGRSLSAGPARTQAQQQPPYRGSATVIATTTTPSAVLDTPYERALRREYAGTGGGLLASDRRSILGGGRTATTPRVTFADIREESGEVMYDDGDGR